MPVNELVRLVRVYSTPWEEKSAALKKLHEDYENKQRQLNIAVKRLQLVDAHVGCVCLKNYVVIYLMFKKFHSINMHMYNLYSISCLCNLYVLIVHSLKNILLLMYYKLFTAFSVCFSPKE